jgi:hypothetical protein
MVQTIYGFRSGKSVSVSYGGVTKTLLFDNTSAAKEALSKVKRVADAPTESNIQDIMKYFDAGSILSDSSGIFQRGSNGQWFLKGYTIPMPIKLVERINLYIQSGAPIDSLVNFWMLCMANPDSRARNDLFAFADRYNFPITPYGYFVGYKSVYVKESSKNNHSLVHDSQILQALNPLIGDSRGTYLDELTPEEKEKVIATYTLVKVSYCDTYGDDEVLYVAADVAAGDIYDDEVINGSKDAIEETLDYHLITDGEYDPEIHVMQVVGPVSREFYLLKQRTIVEGADESDLTFTDIHTRTFSIKLGEVVKMDRSECDSNPEQTCSSGLHIGAPGYVKGFGSGSSRKIIACLVNPAHVVAVPTDYSFEKMRVCEYFPYAISDFDAAEDLKEIDTQFYESDYIGYEFEELKQQLAPFSGALQTSEALEIKRNRLSIISFKD